jgi:acylphosphatase
MKRLTAYVSGKVQKTGYRARVVDFGRLLKLKGTVENLDDGRVKIIAEGDEDKLKWFEEAINVKNTLIQVSSIDKEYSAARGEFIKFYKLVEPGETDSRLDTAADHLKVLIASVDKMSDNLGGKMDVMIQKQDQMIQKQDQMIQKQDQMVDLQHDLIDEVKESRKDLKGYLDQRFEKLEMEVTEMRTALKARGII